MTELDAEDSKLLVLARGAMGRANATSGAAVRDGDGRTYAAGPVWLSSLKLSALQAAVAAALSSGAESFEAAVVLGADAQDDGVAALREVTSTAKVIVVTLKGEVVSVDE